MNTLSVEKENWKMMKVLQQLQKKLLNLFHYSNEDALGLSDMPVLGKFCEWKICNVYYRILCPRNYSDCQSRFEFRSFSFAK